MNDKKLYAFFFAFLLLFSLTIGVVVFRDPIRNVTRAGQDTVDVSKSVVLSDKLEAVVSKDTVAITVFVRNTEGRALDNKPVILATEIKASDWLSKSIVPELAHQK